MLHHLMPLQSGNFDALPTRMIQHPDQLVSLKQSATAEQVRLRIYGLTA